MAIDDLATLDASKENWTIVAKGCKIHASVRKILIYRFQNEKDGEKQKRITIQLEQDGVRVECAFFGKYVAEVVGYLASGDATNVVVIVQCAKIKPFKGKTSLQNVYGATRVLFNPLIQEVAPLRARFLESNDTAAHVISPLQDSAKKSTPEDDFLKHSDGKPLGNSKMLLRVWIGVTLRENVARRYIFLTECISVSHEATTLLGKSCADLLETTGSDPLTISMEILNLIDRTFLFKIEVANSFHSKFEKSYHVKKLCVDKKIINQL
ncbi:uncharacterized protein LOC130724806 [Lotus japonicus]|uniref:uncharacterized protein LOC130724806 n=1 Tax=Lotus japonicus TaxID=34305 RepID=UPI00258EF83A|nr:uncharacterized protein LOC130724806 [Lotus japonicus]